MNKIVTLMLVLSVSIVGAQKKEIKKIQKELEAGNIKQAYEIFNTINESEVEDKYLADYTYYKAANLLGSITDQDSIDNIKQSEQTLDKAIALGFNNQGLIEYLKSTIDQLRFDYAQSLLKQNKGKEAYQLVLDMYNSDNSNLQMLYNAANIAYQSEDFKAAIQHYQTLLDKDYTGVYQTYFGVEPNGNKLQLAKQAIEVGIKTGEFIRMETATSNSNVGSILTNLTWMFKEQGELEQAKAVFDKIKNKYPDDLSVQSATPSIYLQLGMIDAYKSSMEKLLNGKKDPKFFENLATAALNSGNYDEALEFYDKSLELDKGNVVALNNASNAFINLANGMEFDQNSIKGNQNEAIKAFNEQKEGYYKKAMQYLEQAIKIAPDNPNVAQNLLSLYGFFGLDDKAAELKKRFE